jgi:ABC-type nitrate/sulfonate/bicarbonate transport system permease component
MARVAAVAQTLRYIALVLIVLALAVLVLATSVRYLPRPHEVPTEVRRLPYYAGCSFLRMLVAYVFSLLFSFTYGYVAATNKRAERAMMPLLDILQSVPVVAFFPAATYP